MFSVRQYIEYQCEDYITSRLLCPILIKRVAEIRSKIRRLDANLPEQVREKNALNFVSYLKKDLVLPTANSRTECVYLGNCTVLTRNIFRHKIN